jgi:hypothetical protein
VSGPEVAEPLSVAWIEALVDASAERPRSSTSGVVAIAVGKTRQAAFEIRQGRVVAPASPADAGVSIPLSAEQLGSILDGSESLAQAFMRGDVKPEGSTGALLAAVELFEDPTFRQRLSERLAAGLA